MHLLINLVLLLSGIVIAGTGITMARSNPVNWAIAALGVGLLALALYSDRQRVKQRDARVADEIADRISTLTKRQWMRHERFEIPRNLSPSLVVVSTLVLGGGSAWIGFDATPVKWPLMLGGLFFFGIAGLIAPTALAGIGKPALVLDRSGFTTPVDGLVSWQHVEGVHLDVREHRGAKFYSLIFRVPDYAKAVASIHWSQRLLALFGLGGLRRGLIAVAVKAGKERPETIDAVARHLWKTATGRDYMWSPNLSAEANDAFRRMAEYKNKFGENGRIEQELRTNPEAALADLRRLTHDMTVVNGEVKKKMRVANWLGIASIIGVVLVLAWPLLKRWY